MKVEKLVDVIADFIDDRHYLFMIVEEMKSLGLNLLNLMLDLGRDIDYASLSFRYVIALDELIPIAIVIHPKKEKIAGVDLEYAISIIRRYGGYIYGSQESIGFLIPVHDDNLYDVLAIAVPNFIRALLGYSVIPRVIGYTAELERDLTV